MSGPRKLPVFHSMLKKKDKRQGKCKNERDEVTNKPATHFAHTFAAQ